MFVEKHRVSELSAQSLGQAHSVKSILCPVLCVVFSLLFILCFIQGDILTFIRRVDENWIEAKLGEKVGFCPEQFTEVSFFLGCELRPFQRNRGRHLPLATFLR